jgi:hypothetical protein
MMAVELMIQFSVQLHVRHIPGKMNRIANALSQGQLKYASELHPGLVILPFTPPQLITLGAKGI